MTTMQGDGHALTDNANIAQLTEQNYAVSIISEP